MSVTVLAQGARWAVVAKPAHVPVHDSAYVRCADTLIRAARLELDDDVHPVHRLDRPASGCVLLALGREHVHDLAQALSGGRKRYLAFVRGSISERGPVVVERPLDKPGSDMARPARTRLQPIASSEDPRCSLVLAEPTTGRFHQIRRHIRSLSHPILGDSSHGDTRINRWWREEYGLTRLGLHGLSLELQLADGERIVVVCPVPDDLRLLWKRLPWWDAAKAAVPELELSPRYEGP